MERTIGRNCEGCGKFILFPGIYPHELACKEYNKSVLTKLLPTKKKKRSITKKRSPYPMRERRNYNPFRRKDINKLMKEINNIKDQIVKIKNIIQLDKDRLVVYNETTSNGSGVYFIQCEEYVKIGVALDISKRLYTLQVSNPHDLVLLLLIEGDRQLESSLHYKFTKDRIRGEWFRLSPKIEAFIEEMKNK